MAVVYAARDLKLGREVALKVFREELGRQIGPERFLREIRIAATLTHPHIVPLYDSGAEAGQLFYVMPRIRGETLRQRLDRDRVLPLAEAVAIAREVADALAHAHRADILHRDIKPENILLSDGHARVADFGVARSISGRERYAEGDGALTGSGLAIGTLEYMSPEQRAGTHDLDGRSDLFSLGCVLFEMLTGTAPALPAGLHQRDPRSDPVLHALHAVRPDLPPSLDPVLQRALAARPGDRFASADEMARALSAVGVGGRAAGRYGVALAVLLLVVLAGMYAWSREAPVATRAAVLVGDIEGPDGDPVLARVVADLVTAELNQSPRLVAVAPEQLVAVRRSAGVPDNAPLDPARARELATRLSVRALVLGSVRSVGSTSYALVLRAVDPESDRVLATVTAAARDTDFVVQVGALGRQLRRELGERQDEIAATRPVWDVSTRSFPAYRKYVEALRLFNGGAPDAAVTLLQEAVRLDTAFAAAWSALGSTLSYLRQPEAAAAAFTTARHHAAQLTDLGRYRLEGDLATLRDDPGTAVGWYDLALQVDSACIPALNDRALALAATGRYDLALRDFQRAVEHTSFGAYRGQIELLNEAATLIILDSLARARTVARALKPAYAEYIDLMLPVAEGKWVAAESLATVLQNSATSLELVRAQARLTRASALAAQGRIDAARHQLAELSTRSPRDARTAARAELLLCAATGCRVGTPPARLGADTTQGGRIVRALWRAFAGDTLPAVAELRLIARLDSSAIDRLGSAPALLRAGVAAAGGRWQTVTAVLAPAALAGEHSVLDPDRAPSQMLRWMVADAYARQGAADSAIVYFTLLTRPVQVPAWSFAFQGFTASMARQRLALLTPRSGRGEE